MVKYDSRFFHSKLMALQTQAIFFALTYNHDIINLDFFKDTTLVPSREKELNDEVIDIIKILNNKFVEDVANFKRVGERLMEMDNFLKDESLALSLGLEADKLHIDEMIVHEKTEEEKEEETRRRKEAFLPVNPTNKRRVYKVDEGIYEYISEDYRDIAHDFLEDFDVVLSIEPQLIGSSYHIYVNTEEYYDAETCDKYFKESIIKIIEDGYEGDGKDTIIGKISGLSFKEKDGYIDYDLSLILSLAGAFGFDPNDITYMLSQVRAD